MSVNESSKSGQLVLRRDVKFNGVKVFSATMVADREQRGVILGLVEQFAVDAP